MWYLPDYPQNGDDGLYCCNVCVSEFFKPRTNTHSDQWVYYHSKLHYNNEGPEECWDKAKQTTEKFVAANPSDEEHDNHSDVSFCSDDPVGGGGLGEDEDEEEAEEDDDADEDYVDEGVDGAGEDGGGGGEDDDADEEEDDDTDEEEDDDADEEEDAPASRSSSAIFGTGVPDTGASEEPARKKARYVTQPLWHHSRPPRCFPRGQPVRVRVYPPGPDSTFPIPLVPPLRNRNPGGLRSILEEIRHDQRQLRLTFNVMVKTMNALASQVEELHQKFA